MNMARNNPYGDMIPKDMPPEIFEKIIRPAAERKQGAMTVETGANPITVIMKRLDDMERMMAQLSQAQDMPGEGKDKITEIPEIPDNIAGNLPSFIRGEFAGDFRQKPAETILNLMTDIYGRMPEKMDSSDNPVKEMMGIFKNISRQVRKDRLFEKNEDARDMIEKIEEIFKEIPEIEKRADAYEIAYNLVKSKLMEENTEKTDRKKTHAGKEKPKTEQTEEKQEKTSAMERAFVENSGINRRSREETELSPLQKEVCRKMGISESSYRKYLRR